NEAERALAAALAEVMKVERVSADDHFFHDLGAHSLLMARYCSEVRKRLGVAVSMRDVYLNPTVEGLARHLATAQNEEAAPRPERRPLRVPSALEYYGCGALQLLYYALYGSRVVGLLAAAYGWAFAGV